jgi:hypothetical protein
MNELYEPLGTLYPIQIIDIYGGNEWWNIDTAKKRGLRGVIFKAGQGGWATYPKAWIGECVKADFPFGVYWLIDSRYDSGYHVGAIKNAFPDRYFGRLGWWWDIEKPRTTMTDTDYWKTPYSGNGLIQSVIEKFAGWSGEYGGIYTSPGMAARLGWGGTLFRYKALYKILSQMPLWVAQYNNRISRPDKIAPFGDAWTFWQYRERPDYNYFNGDETAFNQWLDGHDYYTPVSDPKLKKYGVTTYALRVRSLPDVSSPSLKTLWMSTQITICDEVGEWYKISSPLEGYVNSKYVRLNVSV